MTDTPHSADSVSVRDPRWPYAALGFGAALFSYFHLFHFPAVPVWHEGGQAMYLEHAERMLHGEVLYRDLFQFNLPGTEFLYLILFRLFGIHLWIATLAMLATATAVTLLVYALARVVLRGAAALLPPVTFLIICQRDSFDGSHHWYSTLFVLIAVNLIARACTSTRLGVACVLLALATLFTSSRGVFVAAGVACFLLWRFRGVRRAARSLAALLAPFLVVLGCAFAGLAAAAGSKVFFESVLIFPLRFYSAGMTNNPGVYFDEWQYVLPLRPGSIPVVGLWLAVNFAVPAILILFFALRFRRSAPEFRTDRSTQALVLYAFASAFALLAVAGAAFALRLNCPAAFAYILGAVMLRDLGARRCLSVALAVACTLALAETAAAALRPVYILDVPRGAVAFLHRDRFDYVSWFARSATPGDNLFGDPDLNFILGLSDPSMLQTVEADAYTRPEQVAALITVLDRTQTRFVVWEGGLDAPPAPGENLEPLRVFLRGHYHVARQFYGGYLLALERNEPAASSQIQAPATP